MKRTPLPLLRIAIALTIVTNLSAGPLPILNGSFEAETIPNSGGNNIVNEATFQPTGIFTGWGASSYTNSFGGVSNSVEFFTSGLTGTNAYRPSGIAFQNTGHTFVAGVTYTLSVDIGRATGELTHTGMEFGFRTSDNTAYLNSVFFDNENVPEGTFQTVTLTYTALPADQGQLINIRLSDYYSGNADLRIDNVRLSDATVGATATVTTVSASPSGATGVAPGTSVTFTATVNGAEATPDGTVNFYDGVTPLGSATLNGAGIATFTTSGLSEGRHSITVTYNGSANFLGSTSSILSYQILQSLPLQNAGFEGGAGYLGGTPLAESALPGWQLVGSVFGNVGNMTAEFTSGLGGTNALYIGGSRLTQQTVATFQTGRTYTLIIDVGNPLNPDVSTGGGLGFGFRTSDDSAFLTASYPGRETITAIPSGTFQAFQVVYTATASDNGNPIKISLEDFYSPYFYRIDNVRILVSPALGSTFASWTAEFGLGANSDLLDSDSDGIANLLEYAQDSSPISATSGVHPTVVLAPDGAGIYLTLTTVKNSDATDLTYTVQSSGDLITWSATNTVVLTNTSTSLIVRDSIPQSSSNPKRFLRLVVSR